MSFGGAFDLRWTVRILYARVLTDGPNVNGCKMYHTDVQLTELKQISAWNLFTINLIGK